MTLTNYHVEGFFPIPLVRDVPLLPPFLRRARPSLPPFLNSLRPFFVVLGGQTSLAMASEDWVPAQPVLAALERLFSLPVSGKTTGLDNMWGICRSLTGSYRAPKTWKDSRGPVLKQNELILKILRHQLDLYKNQPRFLQGKVDFLVTPPLARAVSPPSLTAAPPPASSVFSPSPTPLPFPPLLSPVPVRTPQPRVVASSTPPTTAPLSK